jgi:hypothetical protein
MRQPRTLLLYFAVLQLLDLLSTLIFLRHGVTEANPLIRAALTVSSQPVLALALPKVLAVALALYAWRSGRTRLLRPVNLLFTLCVAWNLTAIGLSS